MVSTPTFPLAAYRPGYSISTRCQFLHHSRHKICICEFLNEVQSRHNGSNSKCRGAQDLYSDCIHSKCSRRPLPLSSTTAKMIITITKETTIRKTVILK